MKIGNYNAGIRQNMTEAKKGRTNKKKNQKLSGKERGEEGGGQGGGGGGYGREL